MLRPRCFKFLTGWIAPGQTHQKSVPSPSFWCLAVLIQLLLLCICGLGWWAYSSEAATLKQRQVGELQAIADFKAQQIADWLGERRSDAKAIIASRFGRMDINRWLTAHDPVAGERLKARFDSLKTYDTYVGIELLDPTGVPRLVVGSVRHDPAEAAPAALSAVARATEPQLIDLHRDDENGSVLLAYLLPIFLSGEKGGPPVGYLRLTIDPQTRLYPLMQSWPTLSPTAETLIVRREGDNVVYLNKLRHVENTPLDFRKPIGSDNLPASKAAQGMEGVFEGTDYRGVKVLSYVRAVPDTPWLMVAKVDRTEVLEGIRKIARATVTVTGLLLFSAGLILWTWWRRREMVERLAFRQELEHIAEASPGVIHSFRLRPDGSMTFPYASPAIREVYGYTPEQLAQDAGPAMARIHPDDARRLEATRGASARHLSSWRDEFRYRHPAKGEIWVERRAIPVRQADGSIIWYGFLSDVTERKRAEEVLRQRNEELEALMESLPTPVFIALDPLCRRIIGNRAASEVFGVPLGSNLSASAEGACKGTPVHFFDRDGGRELPSEELPMQRATHLAKPVTGAEFCIRLQDGRTRWLLGSTVPLFDAQGAVRGAIGGFIDVSASREAQRSLEAHKDLLEQSVAARTAQLLEANDRLKAFTYAASHDLKTPLRGITSFSALLESRCRGKLEGEELWFLDHIRTSAARMSELIDDLLAYAQQEQQTPAVQPVDLAAAVRQVLDERNDEILQRGAWVQIDLPHVTVNADRFRLSQVLRNLVDNALKYTAKATAPLLEIGGETVGDKCRFWVRDNGIGFDMTYHDRIFEVFRRLHSYSEFPGTGVGLALAKKAMEAMGGRIWAESAPGQGATFFLEMPLIPALQQQPAAV